MDEAELDCATVCSVGGSGVHSDIWLVSWFDSFSSVMVVERKVLLTVFFE